MRQKETNNKKQIMLDLSKIGFRLWNNQRYKGLSDKGFWIDAGVGGDGGHDLVGYRIVTITPDMIGKKFAQYVEIEVKSETGHKRKKQKERQSFILENGGFACFAKTTEDVKKVIDTIR